MPHSEFGELVCSYATARNAFGLVRGDNRWPRIIAPSDVCERPKISYHWFNYVLRFSVDAAINAAISLDSHSTAVEWCLRCGSSLFLLKRTSHSSMHRIYITHGVGHSLLEQWCTSCRIETINSRQYRTIKVGCGLRACFGNSFSMEKR